MPVKKFNPGFSPALKQIGRITLYWSALEATVDDALCAAIGIKPKFGFGVTTYLNFKQKIAALGVILEEKHKNKGAKKRFQKFTNRADKLRNERNIAVHTNWEWSTGVKNPKLIGYRSSPRKSLLKVRVSKSESELYDIAEDVIQLHIDFYNLIRDYLPGFHY